MEVLRHSRAATSAASGARDASCTACVPRNAQIGSPLSGARIATVQRKGFASSRRTAPLVVAPHACCGVVSNGCCDVSALKGAVFKLSPVPLPPPKPAIAQYQVGGTGGADGSDARELPVEADRAQDSRAGDLIIGDVVDLEFAGVDVAQDHVGFARHAAEIAEAGELPL